MSARENLEKLLQQMPDERLREIADFAAFLNWQDEHGAWQQFGQKQLARAYGPDEPEYTLADQKPEAKS
jgi:hypothetical protein